MLADGNPVAASPWKIDTNWFLCFGVAKIAFFTGEKSGKAGKSAPRPSFSGETGRKVDCAVQHITNGRDERGCQAERADSGDDV